MTSYVALHVRRMMSALLIMKGGARTMLSVHTKAKLEWAEILIGSTYITNRARDTVVVGYSSTRRCRVSTPTPWCNHANLNPYDYVHLMYYLSTVDQIYGTSFRPIDGPEEWPTHEGNMIPNANHLREQERPQHSRIWNEMNWTQGFEPHCSNTVGHTRGNCPSIPLSRMICLACHTMGHNRRTCPTTKRSNRNPNPTGRTV
ncbi:hypothetical protein LINGRAHAP2_LOCUS9256 [Linum grandiflorum]